MTSRVFRPSSEVPFRLPLAALLALSLTAAAQAPPQETADFWRDQNIYQVLTDRFCNGDPTNDNASGSFNAQSGTGVHGGDFRGLEQKLEYIRALGATAIWISPIVLNANGEYHGYAGRDFYKVDPHWGTLADLQSLTAAAHARGLLVICDVVTNHGGNLIDSGSSGYPGYLAPPSSYALRLRNSARSYPPPFDVNTTNPTLSSLFHAQGVIANYNDQPQVELGELAGLDDFRTELPYVRSSMTAIYQFWIQQAGFDAFRVDTVKHVESGFWRAWCPPIRQAAATAGKPRFFLFGEVFDGDDGRCGSYTGTRSGSAEFQFDSVLDFPLYYGTQDVFARGSGNTGQLENRYNGLAPNYAPSAQNALVTFLDSHDVPRFLNASNAAGNAARLRLALAFHYTGRGVPNLYYGTEQSFNGGADPANREDMFDGLYEQGPSLGDNFNQTAPQFLWIAQLNNLRRLYPALRTGEHANLWANFGGPGLFAYARRLPGSEVYIVLNSGSIAQTIPQRPTTQAIGTQLVNLLDLAEELTVDATGQIPALTVGPFGVKMFTAKSAARPLAPVVLATVPLHDAKSVLTRAPVVLRFSRPMNQTLTQGALSTLPAASGTFSWSAAGDELTWTPSGLSVNTLYTVRLAGSARDADPGTEFHAPFEARFTTGTAAFPALPPSATTSAAGSILATTAVFQAQVNPNGTPTTASFEYGQTTSYGSTTTAQALGAGTGSLAVSAAVRELAPLSTVHFRVVATNANGTVRGADQTFVTLPVLPVVATQAVSGLTSGGATLNATIDPSGSPTTGWFEYGLTSAYGSSTQRTAADDAESYAGWSLGESGGTLLGPAVGLENAGGGLFLAQDATGGRQIDGAKSLGVYSGSGGQSLIRALGDATGAGALSVTLRPDVDNSAGFSGLGLRSAAGTSFLSHDLLSFGLDPSAGNEALIVRGSVNQSLSLGTDLRGALVDVRIDYDAPSGTFTLGAKLRTSPAFTTLRGNLRATALAVTHLGFANFNTGERQDLIIDSLMVRQSPALGSGPGNVSLREILTGLVPNATYHFRAVARNASGLSYGADRTFVAAALTPLQLWRQANFGTTDRLDPIAGDAADADADGLANLLEYVLGTDPKRTDPAGLPRAGILALGGGSYATITFRRPQMAALGATLRLEESTDLTGAWTPVDQAANLVGPPQDQGDGSEIVTIRGALATKDGRAFLRLRAE